MKNTNYEKKWWSPKALKKLAYEIVDKGVEVTLPAAERKEVDRMVESIRGVRDFGENTFMTERLRTYYVGETIKCNAGFEIWAPCRGKPTGTIVAIKTDWGIAFGISKISKVEKYPTAIVGQWLALENAILAKDSAEKQGVEKKEGECQTYVMDGNFNILNGHEKRQFERFILRAKCYFYPEEFSFSRGKNKVSYPNYDEIHRRQTIILGQEKIDSMKPKPSKNKKKK